MAFLNGNLHNNLNHPNHFIKQQSKTLLASIDQPPIEKENSYQIIVNIINNSHSNTIGKAIIYIPKSAQSSSLGFGDLLILRNKFKSISPNLNPYEFNYKRYLKIHNIHHQCFLNENEWDVHAKGKKDIKHALYNLRAYLDNWINKSTLSIKNQKLAKALLLGEKEFLDKNTLKSFSSAGAMHVLAVSGLHVGIIMLILQFILSPIKRIKNGHIYHTVIVLVCVWTYASITGLSPSVTRASLMFSFIIIGAKLQRQNTVYQSIMVSAFIILLYDPYSLFRVGFQLSYLAVIGIVYIQPKLYKSIYFKIKPLDYLWQITTVSIAAQLATFPLGLYYFHQFPNLFLISNIVVIPLAGLLLLFGFLYFLTHSSIFFKIAFEKILDLLFSTLNNCVEFIEHIPFSILWGISIHWTEVLLIYAILLSFIIGFYKRIKVLLKLSLICLFTLILIQYIESRAIEQVNSITIYNVKKDLAIDVFIGSKNTFIGSKSIFKDESKLLFHIKHHWFHKHGNQQPNKTIEIESISNPIIKFNHQSILIYTNNKQPIPLTDFVLLRGDIFIRKHLIKAWNQNKTHIIIHPDLNYKAKIFCEQEILQSQIFDISKEGAFQLNCK